MNIFDTELVDGGLKFGTATVPLEREAASHASSSKVTVGVRPEDIDVKSSGNGIPATVDLIEELGADGYLYCHAEIGGQDVEVVARVDGRQHPMKGDKVVLSPIDRHVHVFDAVTGERLNREVASK